MAEATLTLLQSVLAEDQVDQLLGSEYEHQPVPSGARRSLFSMTQVRAGCPMIITGAVTGSILVLGTGSEGHWCTDLRSIERVPDPPGSAADGDGLGFADHAVEYLDSEGDLAQLSGSYASAQLGADQMFITAHCGFRMVALPVSGGTLPAHAAPFGHQLNVTVTRALPIWISCAQHGIGARWDNHLGR